MKTIKLIILFLLVQSFVMGQSLEIVDAEKEAVGMIGSKIRSNFKIRNRSDKRVLLQVKRIDKQISTGQTNSICWGDDCFDSKVDALPRSIVLEPGQVTSKFSSILKAGITEAESTVKYMFYDKNNPLDAVEFEIFYKVVEARPQDLILKNKSISISNVYPNPVENFAIIDYQIINDDMDVKVLIHNVLGSNVGEYTLSKFKSNLKIKTEDLNPGVYFYSVYIDNDNAVTKKFIIKR